MPFGTGMKRHNAPSYVCMYVRGDVLAVWESVEVRVVESVLLFMKFVNASRGKRMRTGYARVKVK